MKKLLPALFASTTLLLGCQTAMNHGPLKLNVEGVNANQPIPVEFAYCAPKQKPGSNVNPRISWQNAPAGTKSFALLVVDHDVPADFKKANKKGKIIADKAQRKDFYHWVLVDVPASVTEINKGQDSMGVEKDGKPTGKTAYGLNGLNDFSKMGKSQHGGYDGPCPPWNDMRVHHYHFQLFALNTPTLKLDTHGEFTGQDVVAAMKGHILGETEVVGTYTLNKSKMSDKSVMKTVKHKVKAAAAKAKAAVTGNAADKAAADKAAAEAPKK